MSEKKALIERDEVVNNPTMIANEYDITVDQQNGKVFFAGNLDGSEVIIQGVLSAYAKDKPAAAFDFTENYGTDRNKKNAVFSGYIYFEKMPVDVLVDGKLVGKNGLAEDKKEVEEAKVIAEYVEEKQAEAEEKASDDLIVIRLGAQDYMIPDLSKERPKTIKAPEGLSRTQRSAWWNRVREAYPDAFDVNKNYIGWGRAPEKEEKDWGKEAKEQKEEKPAQRQPKPKPEAVTGVGNEFTTMADQKVRSGYFMGKYFPSKDAYSIIGSPAETFDGSKFMFCNKQRTAEMLLKALHSSPSFGEKLNGEEQVYPATNLKNQVFVESNKVYYITNAVTAAQALGSTAVVAEEKES